MKTILVKIIDPIGIHARPAAAITTAANKFESSVSFKSIDTNKIANAKSVINLMSLGAKNGNSIEISVSGSDEENAIEEIKKVMLDNKLIELL